MVQGEYTLLDMVNPSLKANHKKKTKIEQYQKFCELLKVKRELYFL